MCCCAHGVGRGRFHHRPVQLGARIEGQGVHPHLVHLGLRLQAVRDDHRPGSWGGASRHRWHHRVLRDPLARSARQGGHRRHSLEHRQVGRVGSHTSYCSGGIVRGNWWRWRRPSWRCWRRCLVASFGRGRWRGAHVSGTKRNPGISLGRAVLPLDRWVVSRSRWQSRSALR